MDKSAIVSKLFSKKNKDYTYVTAFFFVFSFFVFFIIRPNLISVFEARVKIDELNKINNLYSQQIDKIIEVQSLFETNRDELVYLNEAIATKPEVNKVLSDVDISSSESRLFSKRINVSDINLKDKGTLQKLKSFIVEIGLVGQFEDMMAYVSKLYEQRRLKLIPELQMSKDARESSASSNLDIRLEVEGYYL